MQYGLFEDCRAKKISGRRKQTKCVVTFFTFNDRVLIELKERDFNKLWLYSSIERLTHTRF